MLWVVVIVVVAGGIWWWYAASNPSTSSPAMTENTPVGTSTTAGNAGSGSSTALASGNSDTSLNSNLSQIDGQMSGFNSDSASMNQGLNDQPVQQQQF